MLLVKNIINQLIDKFELNNIKISSLYNSQYDMKVFKKKSHILPSCAHEYKEEIPYDFDYDEDIGYCIKFVAENKIDRLSKDKLFISIPISLNKTELLEFMIKGYKNNNILNLGVNIDKKIAVYKIKIVKDINGTYKTDNEVLDNKNYGELIYTINTDEEIVLSNSINNNKDIKI